MHAYENRRRRDEERRAEGRGGEGETAAAAEKPESDLLVKSHLSGLLSIQELSPEGAGPSRGGRTEREQVGSKGRTG